MAALVAFALAFVAGPALVLALLRLPPRLPVLTLQASGVFAAMVGALVLQGRSAPGLLAALWLGWLLAVTLVAQALRRRLPGPHTRRWTALGAALAAPLPWFGLATAQLMD